MSALPGVVAVALLAGTGLLLGLAFGAGTRAPSTPGCVAPSTTSSPGASTTTAIPGYPPAAPESR